MKKYKKNWLPFEEARAFVRTLNLKSGNDWIDYTESGDLPPNIPKSPQLVYKDKGWKNLGDWLGTGTIQPRKREYISFTEARKFVRSLKLKSTNEWNKYCKSGLKPDNIPSSPYRDYDKEWLGVRDWLGNKKRFEILSFVDARKYVQKQKLKSLEEWHKWSKSGKRPFKIPSNPYKIYKDQGWIGWRDWLGPR